jgi:parallel beta-helix repeat protein
MKTRLEILLAVACLLLVPLAPARSAETVLGCGTVVNGAVTLQSDLLCDSGHGLVLTGGATLDCAGHRITGTGTPGQYGIYLRDGASGRVTNCIAERFEVGVRLRGAKGATVSNSTVRDNLRYGIEVTHESSHALLHNNKIRDNGDEGIHLSGPDSGDGGHQILDNLIKGNRAEGLYLLRSSGNRIAGNTIRNHGAAGIYVKDSARNIIEGNVLINDPLQLVYGSQQNVLIDNTIVGQQIRFKEASSNQVYNLSVRAEGGRPSVAFDFSASSGNLIIDSQAVNPTDHDIRATLISADNVFTRFSGSVPLDCDVEDASGVSVTDIHGAPLACGR